MISIGLRGFLQLENGFISYCSPTSSSLLHIGGIISFLLGFLVLPKFWRGLERLLTCWISLPSLQFTLCSMCLAWRPNWAITTFQSLCCLLSTLKASSLLSLQLYFNPDLISFGGGQALSYLYNGKDVQLKMPLGRTCFVFNSSFFLILWARCSNGGKLY